MNTQSHALMGAVLFGNAVPKRAWVGLLGGVTPDVPMMAIVLTLMAFGVPAAKIFDEMYWENWWQITNAIAHSFLLWGGLLALGLTMRKTADNRSTLLAIFAGSAFLHTGIDFFVHREDAHMSFWPLTRYKFMSPVSYYDPAHYGRAFGLFEAALGVVMAVLLAKQFKNWIVRGLLAICLAAYVAMPLIFMLHMG
jgi:membrane-bound metal-dependent hydrolase YbcI (DUF457 family)